MRKPVFIFLINLMTWICVHEVGGQSKIVAQDSLRSLVTENRHTHEKVSLKVGQTVRYKLLSHSTFTKDRITGIGDSTISFQKRNKLVVTSSDGKTVTVAPGDIVSVTLKTGNKIEKLKVSRVSPSTIEGASTGSQSQKILTQDIRSIGKFDSSQTSPEFDVASISIEPLPVAFKDLTSLKIKRSKERRVAGTVLTVLGGFGTTVGLLSAGNPPSGSDASGVATGFHEAGMIIGTVSLPLLVGGLVLLTEKKIDLEKSWTLAGKSLPTTTQNVPAKGYKKLKAALGFGYASSPGDATTGTLFTIEPAYNVSRSFAVGLRFDVPNLVSPYSYSATGQPGLSITLNGQYYFNTGKARPFVGAGLGSFSFAHTDSQLGFYPRVGFEVGHFFMSFDYNYVPAVTYDYYGLRVGFFVGGGPK